MIKPSKLNKGDTIATISPSWGCAGSSRVQWEYKLGCERLRELGLNVIAAPNSLRGTTYLKNNPQARAEDVNWAFENKDVKAIIANIGGNDSVCLLPYLSKNSIINNPKILCGYSDVMALHLYCHNLELTTFYGDNLLTNVAEVPVWHKYSKYWFEKTFFDSSAIGLINPSEDWSFDISKHTDKEYRKNYIKNQGLCLVQGKGKVRGKLFGGHSDLRYINSLSEMNLVNKSCFEGGILFFEDIPECCDSDKMADFFDWMGQNGYLQILNGIIIGKMRSKLDFSQYAQKLRNVISGRYGLTDLPVVSGLNFGHTSPVFILPYGVMAELNTEEMSFRIVENGVV